MPSTAVLRLGRAEQPRRGLEPVAGGQHQRQALEAAGDPAPVRRACERTSSASRQSGIARWASPWRQTRSPSVTSAWPGGVERLRGPRQREALLEHQPRAHVERPLAHSSVRPRNVSARLSSGTLPPCARRGTLSSRYASASVGLVAEVGDHAQVEQRLRHVARRCRARAMTSACSAIGRARSASPPRQYRNASALSAQPRSGVWRLRRAAQGLFEPGAAFLKVAAPLPEAEQRRRAAQRGGALRRGQRPAQRGAQVVVLGFEAVQRRNLVGPGGSASSVTASSSSAAAWRARYVAASPEASSRSTAYWRIGSSRR